MGARGMMLSTAVLVAGAALASFGCGDAQSAHRQELAEVARSALDDGDAHGALSAVRAAWGDEAHDPTLALVGAEACLQLGRGVEAIDFARAGLAGEVSGDDQRADLEWALGRAHLVRFHELKSESDWRVANASLEVASRAGSHRGESAALLALLQLAGRQRNVERFERFGRLALQLESEGVRADAVRKAFDQLGIDP